MTANNAITETSADVPLPDAIHPVVWWVTLLAPVAIAGGVLAYLWIVRGFTAVAGIAGLAFASFFLGKFIILGGAEVDSLSLTSLDLVVMVILMDLMAASWFVFHLSFMLRMPVFGPKFALLINDGEYLLAQYPVLRRAAFLGLVIFVAIPFSMTGSIGGSILARLLGMSRRATIVAVAIGSTLGAVLMHQFGAFIDQNIGRENPVWKWGGFAILAGILILIQIRYTKAKNRLHARTLATNLSPPLRSST